MLDEYYTTALDWIQAEHQAYEGPKFSRSEDDAKSIDEWIARFDNYSHRAKVLGLDNPLGRQAVAKLAATAVACLESMFRVYGSVPAPGFTSGEHKGDWKIGEHQESDET